MERSRTKEAHNYRYGKIVTPFHAEKGLWDRPIGYWVNQAAIARKWFIGLCGINLLLLLLLIWVLSMPMAHLIIVQVLPTGFVKAIGLGELKEISSTAPLPSKLALTTLKQLTGHGAND